MLRLGDLADGGVLARGEVESESPLRDCNSSPSDFLACFLAGVAMGSENEAIVTCLVRGCGQLSGLLPPPSQQSAMHPASLWSVSWNFACEKIQGVGP